MFHGKSVGNTQRSFEATTPGCLSLGPSTVPVRCGDIFWTFPEPQGAHAAGQPVDRWPSDFTVCEAAEHALAAVSPENSKKVEERIVADTTVEIFSRLTKMVDQHKLPRLFMISLNGNVLWMRGPEARGYYALAECDPAALEEALV